MSLNECAIVVGPRPSWQVSFSYPEQKLHLFLLLTEKHTEEHANVSARFLMHASSWIQTEIQDWHHSVH